MSRVPISGLLITNRNDSALGPNIYYLHNSTVICRALTYRTRGIYARLIPEMCRENESTAMPRPYHFQKERDFNRPETQSSLGLGFNLVLQWKVDRVTANHSLSSTAIQQPGLTSGPVICRALTYRTRGIYARLIPEWRFLAHVLTILGM